MGVMCLAVTTGWTSAVKEQGWLGPRECRGQSPAQTSLWGALTFTLEPIEGPWKGLGRRNAMLRFASAKE